MEAYIYQADLICADCGEKVRKDLRATGKGPLDEDDEYTYASDEYPTGPFDDGGGEADCPQHCGRCGVFLENPLTLDGEDYTRDAVEEALAASRTDSVAVQEWAMYYLGLNPGELSPQEMLARLREERDEDQAPSIEELAEQEEAQDNVYSSRR